MDLTLLITKNLKIIVDEVRRLERILRNVLTYVSPGIPRTEPTDLAGLANRTLRLFRPTLKEKGIECCRLDFPTDLPGSRYRSGADHTRLDRHCE